MKAKFNNTMSAVSGFLRKSFSDIKSLKQNKPNTYYLVLTGAGLLLILCMAGAAMFYANSLSVSPAKEVAPLPTMLAITTAENSRQMQPATEMAPTLTPMPTSTVVPGNLWVVSQLLGKQNVNGYTGLVVEFKNLSTGETKKGQCQSPHDPAPVVGDIYVAEVMSDYILLSPTTPGTTQIDLNSKVQRFIFIH